MSTGNDISMDLKRKTLHEKSEVAITKGHKMTGFMGQPLEDYSKEELIQLIHILNHDYYRMLDMYANSNLKSI